jgi:glycerol-3-phosphate dehydrogenase
MKTDRPITRRELWDAAAKMDFDVAIVGGGANGASLFQQLCRRGCRTLLIDKGDFAGATSQASAMMIWGGLLYLKQLRIGSVWRFSQARERMIRRRDGEVAVRRLRYLPDGRPGVRRILLGLGLGLYWLLGLCRRRFPAVERGFDAAALLSADPGRKSFCYEEGFLADSDARFVLGRIGAHRPPEQLAVNYCALEAGGYYPRQGRWFLELKDTLGAERITATASLVVNCAGVWTDRIHAALGLRSPFKHLLSKGVFLAFERPAAHTEPLVFDMGCQKDVLALIPWGPVSLWGPTETLAAGIEEGFRAGPEDAAFLLERAQRFFRGRFDRSRLVSLRCGIRPLAVPAGAPSNRYPLEFSRGHRIWKDPERPWIAVYGGKITGAEELARAVARRVAERVPLPKAVPAAPGPAAQSGERMTWTRFPGIAARVPSPEWCRRHELCWTLEDYLRRRTNIAQWVPREGLGRGNENLGFIAALANTLCGGDPQAAQWMTARYVQSVRERYDALVARL